MKVGNGGGPCKKMGVVLHIDARGLHMYILARMLMSLDPLAFNLIALDLFDKCRNFLEILLAIGFDATADIHGNYVF